MMELQKKPTTWFENLKECFQKCFQGVLSSTMMGCLKANKYASVLCLTKIMCDTK